MTFSWDLNTATLLLIGAQIVATIVYMVTTGNKAASAMEAALKSERLASDAHEKIAALQKELARDYVHRDVLRDMKTDLMDAIKEVRERLDQMLDIQRRGGK